MGKKDYDKIGKRARMRWDYQGIMINFRKTTVERTLVYGGLSGNQVFFRKVSFVFVSL